MHTVKARSAHEWRGLHALRPTRRSIEGALGRLAVAAAIALDGVSG
jgi:hypothetical protein